MPSAHAVLMGHHPVVPNTVSDTFTRADSTTSLGVADTGQTWVAGSGTWGISTNRAYCVASGLAWIDSTKSDVSLTVTLAVVNTLPGLCMRVTNVSNFIIVSLNKLSNSLQVFRVVAGASTAVTTSATPSFVSGDVVNVVVSGSSWTLYKNGVSAATWTESFNSTATKHGLRSNGDFVSRFDNFSVV